MRGHRQDSAQKWGLPCRGLFYFLKFGVSFLGQKRAVGKWEGCTVISKNGLFFRRMFSFGHSRCLPIEKENIFLVGVAFYPSLFTDIWRCFSRCFSAGGDGHKHHPENISCGGYDFGVLNVRIYERVLRTKKWFLAKGDGHNRHLEIFSVGGLTLTPSNVRICERTFLRHSLIWKLPLRW